MLLLYQGGSNWRATCIFNPACKIINLRTLDFECCSPIPLFRTNEENGVAAGVGDSVGSSDEMRQKIYIYF